MRVISNVTIILYSVLFLLIGVVLVSMAFNLPAQETISYTLDYVYTNPNMRLIIGATGVILISLTLLIMRMALGKMQMERTIAFDNPDGQVTIALGAIEDFIKRLTRHLPEIKELRPIVVATKKGVDVTTRVTLFSDTNIPDITDKIQSIIKGRVQEILGIEDTIFVKVHIAKIVQKEEPKKKEEAQPQPHSYKGLEY